MHHCTNNSSKQLLTEAGVNSNGATHMSIQGFPHNDFNEHISSFLEIYDTQRINGVSPEVIMLKLFSFSLKDKLKT